MMRFVRNSIAPLLALIVALHLAGPARAAEIEGVRFADRHRAGDVTLDLNCTGLLRYKVFLKAYVGALYLPGDVAPGDVLEDVPKRIELSYFWSIDGAAFGPAGEKVLAENVDPPTLASLRERLDRINAAYESVKPGDRYSLTYVPGAGTELALNGERKALIPGADFAAAYFRIWLGERPIDDALRDQLLECRDTAMSGGGTAAGS